MGKRSTEAPAAPAPATDETAAAAAAPEAPAAAPPAEDPPAAPAPAGYVVQWDIKHEGVRYAPGAAVDMTDEQAAPFLRTGAIAKA